MFALTCQLFILTGVANNYECNCKQFVIFFPLPNRVLNAENVFPILNKSLAHFQTGILALLTGLICHGLKRLSWAALWVWNIQVCPFSLVSILQSSQWHHLNTTQCQIQLIKHVMPRPEFIPKQDSADLTGPWHSNFFTVSTAEICQFIAMFPCRILPL